MILTDQAQESETMTGETGQVFGDNISEYPRISVVIPTLNEAQNLPHVLPRIPECVYEVLLVDGHSTDGTSEIARQIRPDIRIINQDGRGKGAALRSGFMSATGDIIVMLDADGSTDPGEIPLFVDALLAGADFAKGSRFLQGGGTSDMPRYRQLGNWGFVTLVRMLLGGNYSDLCYGYNAFWMHILPSIKLDADGFDIETKINVQVLRRGFKIVEVPSFEADRIYGTSHLQTIPDGFRVLRIILSEAYDHYRTRWKSFFGRVGGVAPVERRFPAQRDATE